LLAPGTVAISEELDVSIPSVARLGGYQLFVVAATGPFVTATSRKYGKRPVFLISSMMGIIGTIIGGCATGYHMLVAGRIVQGFASNAFESIVVAVIGDMYFVHQRGFRISLLSCVLGALSSLVSVISGPITTNLGWRYCFWILLPFNAIQFILMFLFCEESSYNRDGPDPGTRSRQILVVTNGNEESSSDRTFSSPIMARKSFFRRLKFWGAYSEDNFARLLFAPFVSLTNLAALWSVIMSGLIVGWCVSVMFIMAQWFSPPPYNYNATEVGYLWIGPAVGGLLASLVMWAISDPISKYCAKRNNGIYEPEFRLFPMILCFFFTVPGLVLYGYGLQQYWTPLITSVILAFIFFGVLVGSIASSAYVLDAFCSLSTEIFVANIMFKYIFFGGMSYYVNNWIVVGKPVQMFSVFAGTSAVLISLAVPMYIWGKRYRSYWSDHDVMKSAGFTR
jgi:MFS family permease